MEDAEGDDGEAGEEECEFGGDVPGTEDDACVFDLGVPMFDGGVLKVCCEYELFRWRREREEGEGWRRGG